MESTGMDLRLETPTTGSDVDGNPGVIIDPTVDPLSAIDTVELRQSYRGTFDTMMASAERD
jgi:hypothetical protein